MSDSLSRVIVGNVVINPEVLRQVLKKSHYFMSYKPETETIKLSVNDGGGGEDILFIRSASYENAVKLAEGLGLNAGSDETMPLAWSKWNPVLSLYHDGSEDAEKLRIEMLKLGMPFHLRGPHILFDKNSVRQETWALSRPPCLYAHPYWSVGAVLEFIREDARRYESQLATTP